MRQFGREIHKCLKFKDLSLRMGVVPGTGTKETSRSTWPIEITSMMINEYKLSSLNQYSPTEVVKHDVTSGECFKSFLLNMMPGQEVPAHSHVNKCVLLLPQTGSGTIFTDDKAETLLESGSIYTDHRGCSFGVRNTGSVPFQLLVILVTAPAD